MGEIADNPIGQRDEDLLGMYDYAEKLAEHIWRNEPPFTIGLYGEWGSGKTSLIQLLEDRVMNWAEDKTNGEKCRFIPFQAWPHKTAEELWRALILTIARKLFGLHPPARVATTAHSTSNGDAGTGPLRGSVRSFLDKNAWVFREPVSEKTPEEAGFQQLADRLDSSVYGGVGNPSGAGQLNQSETIVAAAKALTAALGTVSPLVNGLRTLLGLDDKIDLAKLIQKEKNEATHSRLQSIEQFRALLADLFDKRAKGLRVCVFIDDLDRCMPDVALDLLEAIKVMLKDVRCVFIVAADQQLIGQGLKSRFKDLLEQEDREQTQLFYDRKGREYFEKIIQFGIPVPEATPEQAYRFIAAQFPRWTAASDLIEAVVGTNPRRLKQYCNQLDYKYEVCQAQKKPGSEAPSARQPKSIAQHTPWAHRRLVSIFARDPESVNIIQRLSENAAMSHRALCRAERWLAARDRAARDHLAAAQVGQGAVGGPSPPDRTRKLANAHVRDLCRRAGKSAMLRKLLLESPPLSTAPPSNVATLARLADARPDAAAIATSQDRVFMRLLDPVVRGLPVPASAEQLLLEDLTHLVALHRKAPELVAKLAVLARRPSWPADLVLVERELDGPEGAGKQNALVFEAQELLEAIANDSTPASALNHPRTLFTQSRFSAMLAAEIEAFDEVRGNLSSAPTLSSEIYTGGLSDSENEKSLARESLVAMGPKRQEILRSLDLRLQIARECLELREFAKLDGLKLRWPELWKQLRYDRSSIVRLEGALLNPDSAQQFSALYEKYRSDERFARFISLRPFLKDIYASTVQSFATGAAAPMPVASPLVVPLAASGGITSQPLAKEPSALFENLVVAIDGDAADPEIAMGYSGQVFPKFSIPAAKLEALLADMPTGREFFEAARAMRELGALPRGNAAGRVQQIGSELFDVLFGLHRTAVVDIFKRDHNVRLLLEVNDRRLALMPWESMYIDELRAFPALMRHSICRYMKPVQERRVGLFDQSLRVLAVLSNPVDTAPLNLEGEERMLRQVLGTIPGNLVRLHVVSAEEATPVNVLRAVRSFRPHIFHFVGHGAYDRHSSEGTLIMGSEERKAVIVPAQDLITMLEDYGVILAVLNACDTGTSLTNPAVTGLAGTLVHRGVAAVIATMREVVDEAALMFTRDFYSGLVNGDSVEASLAEARKAVSVEKWDWSVYALFTSLKKLDQLRLKLPVRGSE
jgi:KAP family P-loop domain/CHAT domain